MPIKAGPKEETEQAPCFLQPLPDQKCNRVQPCGACSKSGDASTCHFESRGTTRDDQVVMDRTTKNALTARINKLESILRSVMGAKDQTPQSDDSSHVEDQEFDGITES
ncbi:hypothetical protein VC83_07824 [Pseudogymnoascus destructans]|uniref:Zn(2)-C6 fungal-type domain-containing protein n=1 Tax=Pseudogymnoascus destructans TaxID=655981 RepID=A0A177A0Y0_9PEZI|nr:uncharacterized protein VC83_07824 [Pseudogymnoascus destructans]OAF55747.1 hypothetical protein VC83_07824 [Pseudogymnoascus destructans]